MPSEQAEQRRQQLLSVAMELFAEKGYHATSIADIIERASVARGTFYNYFESKRQIFGQLLDLMFDSVMRVAFPIDLASSEPVPAQIQRLIGGFCELLQERLPLTRILLEQAVGLDSEANEQLKQFYGKIVAEIQEAIEDGQRMGIVRAGNAAVMATCMLGMIKESVYQQLLGTRAPTLEALMGEIFRVATSGILAGA